MKAKLEVIGTDGIQRFLGNFIMLSLIVIIIIIKIISISLGICVPNGRIRALLRYIQDFNDIEAAKKIKNDREALVFKAALAIASSVPSTENKANSSQSLFNDEIDSPINTSKILLQDWKNEI